MPCRPNIYNEFLLLKIKPTRCTIFIFGIKLYMFQTVPLSIIRSFSLYTQQCIQVCRQLASCQQTCMTYTIVVCTVKTPDDGHRNWPKHVVFYSKNKFEKLVHLVGFIIRIYHDARSPERQNEFLVLFPYSPPPVHALWFNHHDANQQRHTIRQNCNIIIR